HVESVVWVAERKDLLSAFFWMVTLLMYALYVEKSKVSSAKSKTCYALALTFFVCGLMSKPMVVTLPLLLLLLDWWPLGRFGPSLRNPQLSTLRRLVREKIPFFALAVVASAVAFYAERSGGTLATLTHL